MNRPQSGKPTDINRGDIRRLAVPIFAKRPYSFFYSCYVVQGSDGVPALGSTAPTEVEVQKFRFETDNFSEHLYRTRVVRLQR